jgi:hypothetical protein
MIQKWENAVHQSQKLKKIDSKKELNKKLPTNVLMLMENLNHGLFVILN